MTESKILDEAKSIVYGDRQRDYGTPLENHTRTAKMWSAYLGTPITARDVCMLNVLQKVSRDKHAPKRDNCVDGAGYFENAELCVAEPESMAALAQRLAFENPDHEDLQTYADNVKKAAGEDIAPRTEPPCGHPNHLELACPECFKARARELGIHNDQT